MKITSCFIGTTIDGDTASMCRDILSRLPQERGTIIRLVLFGAAPESKTYITDREEIANTIAQHFGSTQPVWSYVAQPPFDAKLKAEVWSIEDDIDVTVSYRNATIPYIVIEQGAIKRVMIGGVQSSKLDAKIYTQACEVFHNIKEVMKCEDMPLNSIARQWNYIEEIVFEDEQNQHYQEFNDARSELYSLLEWSHGYPAATGIGTLSGGVVIDIDAVIGEELIPIDNKLQIAAHQYSKSLLLGTESQKTTPKFERAKLCGDLLYISGTAAIRGEESLIGVSAAQQTTITLENIDFLIAAAKSSRAHSLRVYIKHKEDYPQIREVVESYAASDALYVFADICRDELLVEIEATAIKIQH